MKVLAVIMLIVSIVTFLIVAKHAFDEMYEIHMKLPEVCKTYCHIGVTLDYRRQ